MHRNSISRRSNGGTSPAVIRHPSGSGKHGESYFDYTKPSTTTAANHPIDVGQMLQETRLIQYRSYFPQSLTLEELRGISEDDLRTHYHLQNAEECHRFLEAVESFDGGSLERCESECGSVSSVPLSPEIRRINEHHQEPSLLAMYHGSRSLHRTISDDNRSKSRRDSVVFSGNHGHQLATFQWSSANNTETTNLLTIKHSSLGKSAPSLSNFSWKDNCPANMTTRKQSRSFRNNNLGGSHHHSSSGNHPAIQRYVCHFYFFYFLQF